MLVAVPVILIVKVDKATTTGVSDAVNEMLRPLEKPSEDDADPPLKDYSINVHGTVVLPKWTKPYVEGDAFVD